MLENNPKTQKGDFRNFFAQNKPEQSVVLAPQNKQNLSLATLVKKLSNSKLQTDKQVQAALIVCIVLCVGVSIAIITFAKPESVKSTTLQTTFEKAPPTKTPVFIKK
jgi:hypothetical protein